ncbi:MAG: hypothetical protein M3340_08015 [Actinomycetota bacterium]|nr:hypothetical protein [Actinomycetota bacterium]
MNETADLERALVRDLEQLGDRFLDEQFSTELYRALSNRRWRRDGGPEGAISLSWSRAEEVVNDLRGRHDREPLELAQTGGEGELSELVERELGAAGWRSEPLNTGRRDEAHVGQPADSPPPPETGEQHSPAEDSGGWEREAHREADQA